MDIENLIEDLDGGIIIRTEHYKATCDVRIVQDLRKPTLPPRVWQCDPRYKDDWLGSEGNLTFCQAGCLVCSLYSLAVWSGFLPDVTDFAARLMRMGAFEGAYLQHPSRVIRAWRRLYWHKKPDLVDRHSSLIHWRHGPAHTDLLTGLLHRFPVVVEVDFKPLTPKVDQHFVLAIEYTPAAAMDSVEDDLLVMDPWTGTYTSVLTYFNPTWLENGSMKPGVTKVQRVLTGARVWEVV